MIEQSRDTVASCDKFTKCIVLFTKCCETALSIYASQQFASARDYWISITAESIKFWIEAIDNLSSKCIIKMFLFFLYVSYERRYCDAKFESANLLLRNVVVIVIIIIINVIFARSCVVRLQLLTQKALAITSMIYIYIYIYISYITRSWDIFWSRVSKGENKIARFHRAFSHSLYSNSHIHKTSRNHIDLSYFVLYTQAWDY